MEVNYSPQPETLDTAKVWSNVTETYHEYGEYLGQIWRTLNRVSQGSPKSEYTHAFSLTQELAKRLNVELVGQPYDQKFVLESGEIGSFIEADENGTRKQPNMARRGKKSFWGKERLMVAVKEKQPHLTVDNLYWNMNDLGHVDFIVDPIYAMVHDLASIAIKRKFRGSCPDIPVGDIVKKSGLTQTEVEKIFNCEGKTKVPAAWLFDTLYEGEVQIPGINKYLIEAGTEV